MTRCFNCGLPITSPEPPRCRQCNKPLCDPILRDCWQGHFNIKHSLTPAERKAYAEGTW